MGLLTDGRPVRWHGDRRRHPAQDCRRSVTAVKVRAMGGRAKTSRDQERSRAVRREPRWPSGGRAGASSAPQPPQTSIPALCVGLFALEPYTSQRIFKQTDGSAPHVSRKEAPGSPPLGTPSGTTRQDLARGSPHPGHSTVCLGPRCP